MTRLAAEFSVSAQRAEPSRLEVLQAPKVLKRPYTVVGANGERREDPYYWLRDDKRENPEVLDHLKVSLNPLDLATVTCLKTTEALHWRRPCQSVCTLSASSRACLQHTST